MYAYQCIGLHFSTPVGGIKKNKENLLESLKFHHLANKVDGEWQLASKEKLEEAELQIYKIGEKVEIENII